MKYFFNNANVSKYLTVMVKDNNEIILSRKSALLPRQLKQMPFNVKHELEINF